MKKAISLLIIILLLPECAHAYISPTTGSLLAQIIIAFFVLGLAFFRDILRRVRAFLSQRSLKGKDGKKRG